jgi:hypothetical protein
LIYISETTDNTAIAFTDGSCLNNPGPCGAGEIVFVEEETTDLKQPVCKRESIITATNYTSQKVQTVNVEKGKPLNIIFFIVTNTCIFVS